MEKTNNIVNPENALLKPFTTPYQTPPFGEFETKDFIPAITVSIENTLQEIEDIINNPAKPDFQNTIAALAQTGEKLNDITAIFFNLNAAYTSEEIQKDAHPISKALTEFSSNVHMNKALFERIKAVYSEKESYTLTPEEATLLEDTWKGFIKGGANLQGEQAERFKEINKQLSSLTLQFEENVLAETHAYELHLTNEEDIAGIPANALEAAKQKATEKEKEGWIFTLDAPSYIPFMKYADKRELRKELYEAYASRCNKGGKHDNNDIIRQIVDLRLEKATILGYKTYADYALCDRMAASAEEVSSFLNSLLEASHSIALQEKEELVKYAKEKGLEDELERWDWAYYSNKLKQEKYELDDELLRPYFKLENVQEAVFGLANKLYGLTFKEVDNIPKYQEDVRTFEVYDEDDSFLSILYLDFFPRSNKNGGAWMTEFRTQHQEGEKDIRPIVSLVMNFTKPTPTQPSLLTFDEVNTFLHEFGHALHGMLSHTVYSSTAGTNVYRDFVELPSQIMENWLLEKEWLDEWAIHYQTGEKIPAEYIQRIKNAANFQSGYQSDRQLSFGLLDMAWHSIKEPFTGKVCLFEEEAMKPTALFTPNPKYCMSNAFTHIFAGGYAAGYYSYKWSEVLDADAFELFKEVGIFDKEIASSFRKNILEKGGSEHPMELYIRFRGRKPDVKALLKRSGLVSTN